MVLITCCPGKKCFQCMLHPLQTLCPLTVEFVKNHKCWVVRMELQLSCFFVDVVKENLLDVSFHCAFVRPVGVAVCYMPSIQEIDSWKTQFSSALVEELGWKEISWE